MTRTCLISHAVWRAGCDPKKKIVTVALFLYQPCRINDIHNQKKSGTAGCPDAIAERHSNEARQGYANSAYS
jgi:hypothetical protein